MLKNSNYEKYKLISQELRTELRLRSYDWELFGEFIYTGYEYSSLEEFTDYFHLQLTRLEQTINALKELREDTKQALLSEEASKSNHRFLWKLVLFGDILSGIACFLFLNGEAFEYALSLVGIITFLILGNSWVWFDTNYETEGKKRALEIIEPNILGLEEILRDGGKNVNNDSIYDDKLYDVCLKIPSAIEKNVDFSNVRQIFEPIQILGAPWSDTVKRRGNDGIWRCVKLVYLFLYFFESRLCIVKCEINVTYGSVEAQSKEWKYDHIASIDHSKQKFEIRNINGESIQIETVNNSDIKFDREYLNEENIKTLKRIIREKTEIK